MKEILTEKKTLNPISTESEFFAYFFLLKIKFRIIFLAVTISCLLQVSKCGLIKKLTGKGGSSGSAPGCGRLMSFMAPLCVQRPNYGNNQWIEGGGSSGWGSMRGGWAGSMAGTSGYYPNSMGMNNYWLSYTGSGYGAPSTAGYGTGYGGGYGSGYDTGTNQWSPSSYGSNEWTNNWSQGGGHRRGKTSPPPQVDR